MHEYGSRRPTHSLAREAVAAAGAIGVANRCCRRRCPCRDSAAAFHLSGEVGAARGEYCLDVSLEHARNRKEREQSRIHRRPWLRLTLLELLQRVSGEASEVREALLTEPGRDPKALNV